MVLLLPSVLALMACSGKPAGTPSAAAAGGGDTAASALGAATFSALVDGQPVSGGAIDGMQQQNAAYTIPARAGEPAYLLFNLYDTKTPTDSHFNHSFRFYLPKQLGAAANAHLTANVDVDTDHLARYSSAQPTITVTSLSSARVAGTFSGKLTVSPDTPNAARHEISISDGKFDIPMATSRLTPP